METKSYVKIDPRIKVGGLAIADGQSDVPVRVITLGLIFATVEDITSNYRWDLMANRLKAVESNDD